MQICRQYVCARNNHEQKLKHFLFYTTEKNRLPHLIEIKNECIQTINKLNQIVEGSFKTPIEVNPSEYQAIQQQLEKKFDQKLKLKFETDPQLIGGFQIQFGNNILDNSIQNKLEKFKQEINKN